MGQQQLLIQVFAIVLVGGLVVAGTHALSGSESRNSHEIVIRDALAIVHDLQTWKRVPVLLGGADGIDGFGRVDFSTLGYQHTLLSKRVYKTDHACYMLRPVGPDRHAEVRIYAPSCAERDFVARVVVGGPGPGDLDWSRD